MFYFTKKQTLSLGLGLISTMIILKIPLKIYRALTIPIFACTTLLLAGTLIPGLSHTVNGASRWLNLGFMTFQPAELAKLSLIIFLAKNMSRPGFGGLSSWSGLLSCLAPLGIFGSLLMMQPDFGTTFLLCLITFFMMFVGGLPLKFIFGAIGAGVLGIAFAIWQEPYRMSRVTSFLDPWASAQTGGFQIIQSYLSYYNGGLVGLGLGGSRQKLYFLPEAHTDFILSVIGEELGLIGVSFVIVIFAYITWTGFKITMAQTRNFEKLLAFGLTCLIGIQAAINMGVSMGLLPTKGMPLPFISHGSSSLMVFLWVVGILVRLNLESDQWHEKEK